MLFGAAVLAAATSLPELSTGLRSVRHGDYQLAATLLLGPRRVAGRTRTDIYLAALGIVLTLICAAGLLFRPRRHIAPLGVDSLAVVIPYGLGMIGLLTVSNMR